MKGNIMSTLIEWAKPELIWFVIGLVMLLLEFSMPGLVIFFFGVGAWLVAAICLFADISVNTQLIIFILASVLLLITLRKWLKNTFIGRSASKKTSDEISEEFLGEKAKVLKEITPETKGRVEFHGSTWDAESDENIPEGTTVEIIGKDNITLKVKSLKER